MSATVIPFRRTQDEPNVTTVKTEVSKVQEVSSTPARLEDIYGGAEPDATFVAKVYGRFSMLAALLRAARTADDIDRDDAVNQLKAELPRTFALQGWSDGALAIITALHHGL